MKMITLFLPEKYLEMFDTLVATGMYPNRSEALRMAAWKFLHESVRILKSISAARTTEQQHDTLIDELGANETDEDDDEGDARTNDIDDLLELVPPA